MENNKEYIEMLKREPDRRLFTINFSTGKKITEQEIEEYVQKLREKFRDKGFKNES